MISVLKKMILKSLNLSNKYLALGLDLSFRMMEGMSNLSPLIKTQEPSDSKCSDLVPAVLLKLPLSKMAYLKPWSTMSVRLKTLFRLIIQTLRPINLMKRVKLIDSFYIYSLTSQLINCQLFIRPNLYQKKC